MRSGGLRRCGLSLRPFLESFPFLSPGSSWCIGLCRVTIYDHEVQRPPAEGTRCGKGAEFQS